MKEGCYVRDKEDRRHPGQKNEGETREDKPGVFPLPPSRIPQWQGKSAIGKTGQNCYSIIKELKGGFSAVLWQSVGVFFNNNLNRDYDTEGDDKEIEAIVRELEASNAYRYQMYQQQALLQKVKKP